MVENTLPAAFADLESHAREWALPTEKDRFEKRTSSTLAEVRALNDALYARIDAIIAYLDAIPLDAIAGRPEDARLLSLARAYMETSHPVDLDWTSTDLDDAFPSDRFEFLPPSR